MPIILLLTALCAGLPSAAYWSATGGTVLGSFMAYVFAGNLAMIGPLGHRMLFHFR